MGAVEKRKVTRFPPNKKPRLFKEKGWDYLWSNTLPRCSKADSTFSQSSQKLQQVLIALQLQFFSYDFSTLSDSTFSRVAISLLTHLLIHPQQKCRQYLSIHQLPQHLYAMGFEVSVVVVESQQVHTGGKGVQGYLCRSARFEGGRKNRCTGQGIEGQIDRTELIGR